MQKKRSVMLVAAALLALPLAALAQTSTGTTTTTTASTTTTSSTSGSASVPLSKLADKYEPLAGSGKNSQSLVNGLRNGSEITLTTKDSSGKSTTTTFTPATGKMGVGNVNISLALAQASLKEAGITNPTADQLKAALNGGTVTNSSGQTTTLTGVLAMRADGKGWGQIAKSLGFKLGDVMRPEKANAAIRDHKPETRERVARTDRVERTERVERAERVERPDRPERPTRVERPEKPERVGPGR